jgi:hypothetical protein
MAGQLHDDNFLTRSLQFCRYAIPYEGRLPGSMDQYKCLGLRNGMTALGTGIRSCHDQYRTRNKFHFSFDVHKLTNWFTHRIPTGCQQLQSIEKQ